MGIMKRGDIYYIASNNTEVGNEQQSGRPAIIVSNDKCNEFSGVVEIVYLTAQSGKKDLPTHVQIDSAPKRSIALCEQVNSVSVQRIGDYAGRCSADEIEKIDKALAISLGIEAVPAEKIQIPLETISTTSTAEEISNATAQLNTYKILYNELINKLVAMGK